MGVISMYGIYSITNKITGTKYIGQTKNSFEARWKQHKKKLRANNHDNEYLQRSWNKYGEEAFEFKIVHICDELDILSDLEIYYIKKYDTYNNGFNLTTGGELGLYDIPEETRIKMINSSKEISRDKSDYTEHQIFNVKKLLAEGVLPINKISKLTGVRENVIYSVKNLQSWVDVNKDVNDKLKQLNYSEIRNKNMLSDLTENNMTFKEISAKYGLQLNTVRVILKKHLQKGKK